MWKQFFQGIVTLFVAMSLSACQVTKDSSAHRVPSTIQIEQIASVLAGASYLKAECGKTGMPSEYELYRYADDLARKRGWDTQSLEYQALPTIVKQQSQLINDTTSLDVKCASLSSALVSVFPDK